MGLWAYTVAGWIVQSDAPPWLHVPASKALYALYVVGQVLRLVRQFVLCLYGE